MNNLRFGMYEFRHNPASLTVRYQQETAASLCWGAGQTVQNLGPGLCVVEGEGELFWEDGVSPMEQFAQMREVFCRGEGQVLSGAGLEPMNAIWESLTLLGQGGDRWVRYQVRFLQERNG